MVDVTRLPDAWYQNTNATLHAMSVRLDAVEPIYSEIDRGQDIDVFSLNLTVRVDLDGERQSDTSNNGLIGGAKSNLRRGDAR